MHQSQTQNTPMSPDWMMQTMALLFTDYYNIKQELAKEKQLSIQLREQLKIILQNKGPEVAPETTEKQSQLPNLNFQMISMPIETQGCKAKSIETSNTKLPNLQVKQGENEQDERKTVDGKELRKRVGKNYCEIMKKRSMKKKKREMLRLENGGFKLFKQLLLKTEIKNDLKLKTLGQQNKYISTKWAQLTDKEKDKFNKEANQL